MRLIEPPDVFGPAREFCLREIRRHSAERGYIGIAIPGKKNCTISPIR